MVSWNTKVKRILKSELVKRGVSNAGLAVLLNDKGINETKASIDSKISRGSFSACFLIQCLSVLGCTKIEIEEYDIPMIMEAESDIEHNKKSKNG